MDLGKIGQRTIWVDCDVLQADGGTRTASITGASVAMAIAVNKLVAQGKLAESPMKRLVSAVSVGMLGGEALLDLCYVEDKDAEVDMNLVMTDRGEFVEVQGSGEEAVFTADQMSRMLELGRKGLEEIAGLQRQVIADADKPDADALEGLGVNLDVNPAEVGKILHDQNFVFLFAQRFHPCFRNIAPIRNELGIRTLFNLLGPLINPSRPTHILLGVARPNLVKLMAETLAQSSVHRAAVVCGAGGYDEITPIGPNEIIILDDGKLEPLTLDPADYGIPACTPEDLAVSSRDEAVAVLRELLAGRGPEAMRNMLALNVGMSIYLLEGKLPLATCIAKAREALASGVGGRVLHAA